MIQSLTWLQAIDTRLLSLKVDVHLHLEIIVQVPEKDEDEEEKAKYIYIFLFSGQLGLGHTDKIEKVSCIKSLKSNETGEKVILAACGRESSIVATDCGSIYSFGSNSRSQLGFEASSESEINQPNPTKIDSFKSKNIWKQIAMGAEHACALTDDGLVYVWGANDEGQCGQIKKYDVISKPRELRMEQPVVAM